MAASKMQMKKNNITALVAHAVNNQEKLDEMFAANKKTRREASKKYGKSKGIYITKSDNVKFINFFFFILGF